MKLGNGSSAGKLIDQLDWIKSMTNVTGVVHVLIGTYELLNLRNLSGQASRRGLDLHFPRYKFQSETDQRDFQGVLLALLNQVPISVEIESLMQHWVYFYERSIGCVGVLKDWLIRALAAALYDKSKVLSLEYLKDHALSLAQCERMAIDATVGEQQLNLSESRHQQLWLLLNNRKDSGQIATGIEPNTATVASSFKPEEIERTSKKTKERVETPPDSISSSSTDELNTSVETSKSLKQKRRVGKRKPKRDPVS